MVLRLDPKHLELTAKAQHLHTAKASKTQTSSETTTILHDKRELHLAVHLPLSRDLELPLGVQVDAMVYRQEDLAPASASEEPRGPAAGWRPLT